MKSSGGLGSFIAILLEILRALLGGAKPKPAPSPIPGAPPPVIPPDSATEPAQITTTRVLLINYDPLVDATSGQKLSQKMNWRRVDELVAGFNADILETSGGMARYDIVQRVELDEFPPKVDGFRYDAASYDAVMHGAATHQPEMVDYQHIISRFNLMKRIAAREFEEVWVFAFPQAGFYESRMAGSGAFWCNAPPQENTGSCPRRFIIMGFSYERGVGEMLESFGHRVESIMEQTFRRTSGESNLWKRFIRYDKVAHGKAECGNVHFAPNSEGDYDWNNPRPVPSRCDDWYNFPRFRDIVKAVNSDEWGNGDIRLHHKWWLKHLPRVAGRTSGVHNNWWQYIMDPNQVNV